jgi:DNA polymerase (family 10)
MPLLDTPAVAKLLVEIGQRLALAGEKPYKARSYSRAAQSLMTLTVPLEEVVASGRLQELPGVGAALSETIEELHRARTTASLERMRADLPASALELARIPGLAAKKVVDLHRKLESPPWRSSRPHAGTTGSLARKASARRCRPRFFRESSC